VWHNLGHMSADNQSDAGKASTDPKWFLASKTILGAIVTVLPAIFSVFGAELQDTEAQNVLQTFAAFIGSLLVVWGRFTAKRPVALKAQSQAERMVSFLVSAGLVGGGASILLQGCAGIELQGQACYEPTPGVQVCTDGTRVIGKAKRDGASFKVTVPLRDEGITGGLR
jgi:hypothetical protein